MDAVYMDIEKLLADSKDDMVLIPAQRVRTLLAELRRCWRDKGIMGYDERGGRYLVNIYHAADLAKDYIRRNVCPDGDSYTCKYVDGDNKFTIIVMRAGSEFIFPVTWETLEANNLILIRC